MEFDKGRGGRKYVIKLVRQGPEWRTRRVMRCDRHDAHGKKGILWELGSVKESIATTSRRNLELAGLRDQKDMEYRINFFAAGFIDTVYTWLCQKDRTPRQMVAFLLEMLRQLRM